MVLSRAYVVLLEAGAARGKKFRNEIEMELANEANMSIFSHASNTNSFGLIPQYLYDNSDDTLYRPITTSIWKLSMDENGAAFPFLNMLGCQLKTGILKGNF